MLETLAIILIVMWLLGMAGGMGNVVHIILVAALVLFLARFLDRKL